MSGVLSEVRSAILGAEDLVIVLAYTVVTAAFLGLPGTEGTPVRVAVSLGFVLFVSGYPVVSALFPRAETLTFVERSIFSFGTSVSLAAIVAMVFNFLPSGIRFEPVTEAILAVTAFSCLVAVVNRWRIRRRSEADPFSPRILSRERLSAVSLFPAEDRSTGMRVATALLGLAIVLSVVSVGYALGTPRPGDSYTEFALYTERNGTLVAGGYPTELGADGTETVVVSVTNHEHRDIDYRVVVRLSDTSSGETERLVTFEEVPLEHEGVWRKPVDIDPSMTGEDLRLEFLLYRGEGSETVYHQLHLNVDVTDPTR